MGVDSGPVESEELDKIHFPHNDLRQSVRLEMITAFALPVKLSSSAEQSC